MLALPILSASALLALTSSWPLPWPSISCVIRPSSLGVGLKCVGFLFAAIYKSLCPAKLGFGLVQQQFNKSLVRVVVVCLLLPPALATGRFGCVLVPELFGGMTRATEWFAFV